MTCGLYIVERLLVGQEPDMVKLRLNPTPVARQHQVTHSFAAQSQYAQGSVIYQIG